MATQKQQERSEIEKLMAMLRKKEEQDEAKRQQDEAKRQQERKEREEREEKREQERKEEKEKKRVERQKEKEQERLERQKKEEQDEAKRQKEKEEWRLEREKKEEQEKLERYKEREQAEKRWQNEEARRIREAEEKEGRRKKKQQEKEQERKEREEKEKRDREELKQFQERMAEKFKSHKDDIAQHMVSIDARVSTYESKVDQLQVRIEKEEEEQLEQDKKIVDLQTGLQKVETSVKRVADKVRSAGAQATSVSWVKPRAWDYQELAGAKRIEYYGKDNEDPVAFIKSMEELFDEVDPMLEEETKLKMVVRNLKGTAEAWWKAVMNPGDQYGQFKAKFLARYWGFAAQEKIRRQLDTGKYYEMGPYSKSEYFVVMVNKARNLDPPIPERYLVNKVMMHFGREVRNASLGVHRESVASAIDFLNGVETDNGSRGINGREVPPRYQQRPPPNMRPPHPRNNTNGNPRTERETRPPPRQNMEPGNRTRSPKNEAGGSRAQ